MIRMYGYIFEPTNKNTKKSAAAFAFLFFLPLDLRAWGYFGEWMLLINFPDKLLSNTRKQILN